MAVISCYAWLLQCSDRVEPTPEPCVCPPGPPGQPGMKVSFFSVSFLTVFAFCRFALHTVSNHEIAQTPYCPVHIKKELNLVTRSFFACVPTLQTH